MVRASRVRAQIRSRASRLVSRRAPTHCTTICGSIVPRSQTGIAAVVYDRRNGAHRAPLQPNQDTACRSRRLTFGDCNDSISEIQQFDWRFATVAFSWSPVPQNEESNQMRTKTGSLARKAFTLIELL